MFEKTYKVTEVQELAKKSLDFLAGLALPDIYQYSYPPVYQTIWSWLLSFVHVLRAFPKLALGLPRGFAKTTFIKIFVLYCILFTQRKFILIICSTAQLAENLVADICDMLDEPNIKKVFGDWRLGLEKDTLALKKFGYRGRNIVIAGIGAGTSLRGLNIKHVRPDVMVFDDIQTREQAESKIESEALERWMYGTAMKAKMHTGCIYVFIANMYPTNFSILRKLKHNPSWTKFITGGILADGTSLWEELQPLEQLLDEFESDLNAGHPEIFYAEVMNDENASVNNLVDISKIPVDPYSSQEIHQGNFIIIDPAAKNKANSDDVAIGYFEIFDSKPVLKEVISEKLSPLQTIERAVTLALTHNCRCVAIESVAYQATLAYWFNYVCIQRGIIGIEAVEVYPGHFSKNSRIIQMFKSLLASEFYLSNKVRSLVLQQITAFNILRTDNKDDILDLLTYCTKVLEQFGEYIASWNVVEMQEYNKIPVRSVLENCPV